MFKPSFFFCSFLLFSCNSPEARLERLQHHFWDKLALHDYFEVKLKNEVLHWPLPPSFEVVGNQKEQVLILQTEAKAIEREKLTVNGQQQLDQMNAALDYCASLGEKSLFDPSRCCVGVWLRQFSGHPEFPVLLENIPMYYAQIEQRWQTPDVRFVEKAVHESQSALDLLKGLEENERGDMAVKAASAKAAIKDFIGLCQSALLEAN